MKKNLRIVSAAAAALIAVAPVAASAISNPAHAAVSAQSTDVPAPVTDGGDQGSSTEAQNMELTLKVLNAGSLKDGDSASSVKASLTSNYGTPLINGKTHIFKASDITYTDDKIGTIDDSKAVSTLQKGVAYVAVTENVTLSGLAKNGKYNISIPNDDSNVNNGNKVLITTDGTPAQADPYGSLAPDKGYNVVSKSFTVSDTTKKGAPYVQSKATTDNPTAKAVDSGSIDLDSDSYSVKAIKKAITDKYEPASTAGKNTTTNPDAATADWTDIDGDIKASLSAAGITVKADGTFDKPATTFPITLNLLASNGKTNTFTIVANPNPTKVDKTFPGMSYGSATADNVKFGTDNVLDSLTDADNKKFNYIPVNGTVDKDAIAAAFPTTVSGTDNTPLKPTVDISKVNTKVAGKYPVTVSATNADKKTTSYTFYLTVGEKGANYKTVQSGNDATIPVYQIDGNKVTTTKDTVKNGDQIATFGDPVTIGGKSYTRINSDNSDEYVETKYVDGSVKPEEKTSKKIMHNAYIYDKDHNRVGKKMLAAYTDVDVYGEATKDSKGNLVYKIGDNQYVMADNITGTERTLSHNSYVYATSKKRANNKDILAGTKVTTYGSPYTFKNGKSYYRVGGPAKQYIKVVNFAK
ncbi:SLAP domain-containing protein [Lactobacillus acetotolerans]|jgi:hypothetical protein|uniref:SLAP domain-containing protein n=1 Tax=Lactobacillus acetotolerans TaxID=1600 RepID=UPI00241D9FA4|nr:SLAP domain-containing protein [Lactobacillus acetotolerans]